MGSLSSRSHLRKCLSSTKFTILISWSPIYTPLIPCHSLKWVMTLVVTLHRNTESGQSCKIINMIRVKGSERRPFISIFRLNIVLHDSYQADEVVMEIEEWKQKVTEDYVKSFIRFLLSALETPIVS